MSQARPPLLEGLYEIRLDRMLVFRLRDARGRVDWDSTAVIGQPYMSVMRAETIALMERKFAQAEIGIWSSPTLSTHFPNWTTLLICARGLYRRRPHEPFEPMLATLKHWQFSRGSRWVGA